MKPDANSGYNEGSQPALKPGDILEEKFEILDLLGQGAKGVVYKVKHLILGETCALKILQTALQGDEESIQRFHREAQLCSQLQHQNIVSVKTYGLCSDRRPYIVMEFLEGEDLASLLKKNKTLSLTEIKDIFAQIAGALSHAHEKKIAHRDIKPANIFISKAEDGSRLCKLVDLGLAKVLDAERAEQQKLTKTGVLTGTPSYMSPEQCKGQEAGTASDIYSLAVVIYETLCGELPFKADTDLLIMQSHLRDEMQLPSGLRLPTGLADLLSRAFSKEAERRPDAKELKSYFESVDVSMLEQSKSPENKKIPVPAVILTLLCLAILFLIVYIRGHSQEANLDQLNVQSKTRLSNKAKTRIGKYSADMYLKDLHVLMTDGDYRKNQHMIAEGTSLAKQAIAEAEKEGNPETIVLANLEFLSAARNEPQEKLLSRMNFLEDFISKHKDLSPRMCLNVMKEHAELLSESGRFEQARDVYEKASSHAGGGTDSLSFLKQVVYCSSKLKDLSRMEIATDKMLKIERNDDRSAEALALIAQAYAENGNQKKLSSSLQELSKIEYKGLDDGVCKVLSEIENICREKKYAELALVQMLNSKYKAQKEAAKKWKKSLQPTWLRPRSSIEDVYLKEKAK